MFNSFKSVQVVYKLGVIESFYLWNIFWTYNFSTTQGKYVPGYQNFSILPFYVLLINWYNFSLGSISKDFIKDKQNEISLNGPVYEFSADHSSIKKEDKLNIHEYLKFENNTKW